MPIRKDIKKVVILGSGPIVIGQACEFDYSGTQACKSLMGLGLEVILVNSNPATIMTDPEVATRVYVEPLKVPYLDKILEKEKPDAIIPTLGGQTALNLALELFDQGVLKKHNVQLLGADPKVIRAGEDREIFRGLLDQIGAKYPRSEMVRTFEAGLEAGDQLGFPLILRPNYTLGGGGGGIAFSKEEFRIKLAQALHESPTSEVLVEESILGWKEFELEVMRDRAGTFVVICSIENFDPCGVHTGDSITVAPQQTLSDKEYQDMRDEARKIIEAVGVETGGANIQFAVHPETGERLVIEMNPRVSRSSALASKATGFPIAKIAAQLALGFTLDEIQNDITKTTPACFEPALDYVVTKIPRFAFEKFPGTQDILNTQMKSVGEAMGIGRTLKESFHKAILSLEGAAEGFREVKFDQSKLSYPNSQRIFYIIQAFRDGVSLEEIHSLTQIHPWFLEQLEQIVDMEKSISAWKKLEKEPLLKAKRHGFSDAAISKLTGIDEIAVRQERKSFGLTPGYFRVDTCAGEFASETPYFYSTYWTEPDPKGLQVKESDHGKPVIALIGSGPNRIGQGIEFDYSCVRSVREFQRQGYFVAMLNSNPETVSTDYDTSNALFFEPVTEESIANVLEFTKAQSFVAQLGGQTPINLAAPLVDQGFSLMGSTLEAIDRAEDRGQFSEICKELGVKMPQAGMASNISEALKLAQNLGYPIMCRPSYVLGGRHMEIVESDGELEHYFESHAATISEKRPCLMDQFLERALEVDVDLACGPDWAVVGGIIEHIEAAGVHSGDSMGVVPPQRLKEETALKIEAVSVQLAKKLGILGFLNLQLAIKDDEVYVLEANPRSSRSVPFIAKSTKVPLVDLGVRGMLGLKSSEVKPEQYDWKKVSGVSVKGVVFPFKKYPESDSILGPEMRSTGEAMGRGADYGEALLKAFVTSHMRLPQNGKVFLSLRDKDKDMLLPLVKELQALDFSLVATTGTAKYLEDSGISCDVVKKVHQGNPNCVDLIRSGEVALVINTTSGRESIEASFGIRRSCVDYSIPCLTESDAAEAFLLALKNQKTSQVSVSSL
ncbi:MAG: carbamoyl phosphate synthase large subunit [Bdellovibrionaceae bacterium]|nr:carbamoyl phosphate synthase large subunit [Pseudobdellovibrionaceae bacterium]|tara:strand:+ start:62310 stop:65504 length:3195 start_codon:yes stop_codon:yes gene_type:complete